jgi:hypothetical protein
LLVAVVVETITVVVLALAVCLQGFLGLPLGLQ